MATCSSVCLFICLSPVKCVIYSPGGSTWQQAGAYRIDSDTLVNPVDSKGNYSATSNNTKLVHWLLMGGLLRLVQQGGDWAGPQAAQAPLRCTKCNSPPINGQCTNHRIMVSCSEVLMCPWVKDAWERSGGCQERSRSLSKERSVTERAQQIKLGGRRRRDEWRSGTFIAAQTAT